MTAGSSRLLELMDMGLVLGLAPLMLDNLFIHLLLDGNNFTLACSIICDVCCRCDWSPFIPKLWLHLIFTTVLIFTHNLIFELIDIFHYEIWSFLRLIKCSYSMCPQTINPFCHNLIRGPHIKFFITDMLSIFGNLNHEMFLIVLIAAMST
jgi:hypothetical protein